MRAGLLAALVWLVGCGVEPAPATLVPLDAPRLARRLSIDLRGVLPSTAELDEVEAHPEDINALREAWLADPRFEERLVMMYQERWRTSLDEFRGTIADYGLPDDDAYAFNRSVGEEPLRLVAHVVATNRSYADVVTADWTMSDPLLASLWPIAYPDGATGWQESRYTDDRPAAGVLTVNGLWWRYISPIFNENRARSAAIFDLLVCTDVLSRPVVLSSGFSITDSSASDAIQSQPTCLACHSSIEPVAATLFGFLPLDDQSALEMQTYHPERENLGASVLNVEPAWMGHPVSGLEELGDAIAQDPRFVDCAVQTMAEGLLRRSTDSRDVVLLRDAREPFVNNGLHLKDAIRSITQSAAYTAGGVTDGASDDQVDQTSTRRMLVASQLRSIDADLAGLDWRNAGYDQLDNDVSGFRVLGGSVDGDLLSAPQRTPGLTWSLTVERAAEVSAGLLVDHDLGASSPTLLPGVTSATTPADAAFATAVSAAWWRVLAERPTDDDVAGLAALWQSVVDAGGSSTDAWTTVVAVLLRDPDFVSY